MPNRKWIASILLIPLMALLYAYAALGQISAFSPAAETTGEPSGGARDPLVGIPPGATPTPTPFQPVAPTPTYLPDFAMGTPAGEGNLPWDESPAPTLLAEGRVNLLLLGSDQRPYEGGFRTDTILLVSLNPAQGTASLVSFPRDLYVSIPGVGEQRINTAMGYGGFPLLADTLAYNFGVRPDYYVMVNFWAFVETVDSLGGIEVMAAQSLRDHRDGHGTFTIPAGLNQMDGETALWYVRSRYSSNDFDRTRRQQEVILALFQRLLSLNALEKAPQLYEIYSQNVTTNLTFAEIAPLLPLAAQLQDTSRIAQYAIGPAQVIPWRTPGGAQVLLPIPGAINALLWQALSGP